MSLPPEQIRLKRKATDAAPETLYLQNDGAKRRRRAESDFCFQLLKPNGAAVQSNAPAANKSINDRVKARPSSRAVSTNYTPRPGVPVVRATKPGEEIEDERRRRELVMQKNAAVQAQVQAQNGQGLDVGRSGEEEQYTSPSLPTSNIVQTPQAVAPAAVARRFHLTRPTVPTGANARNTGPKLDVATFAERRPQPSLPTVDKAEEDDKPPNESEDAQQTSAPRKKRPKANAAEKRLLEAQQKKLETTDVLDPDDNTKPDDPETQDVNTPEREQGTPSKRTQQILLDMAHEHKGLSDFSSMKAALDSEDMMDIDPDDGYVYETYIRVPRSVLVNMQHEDPTGGKSIGILVIEDEDQQLWETYADVDEDTDWDEEDEDSNAEDNPANEYPEEEVDSDDEYGYQSYKYRNHAASDDEEFDLENDVEWSDDGGGSSPPFR